MAKHIFIVAGDVSGEMHAARLVSALKRIDPGCTVSALGGARLEKVADKFLFNLVNLSAFGFTGPARLYLRLRGVFRDKIQKSWEENRPDKLVLVDYYGFNIHVAELAHDLGIPVYYYISPQVWASRPGRIKKIKRFVKKVLVILPFESELYRKEGIDAVFVGHPLLDTVPEPLKNNAPAARPSIGLFLGSRPSVAEKHLELCAKAGSLIQKELPCDIKVFGMQYLKPLYENFPFPVVFDEEYRERSGLDLAITVSGTVSLENAMMGIPMIVIYKLSWLNYLLARLLINVKAITMVNILAGAMVVPELIQRDATPENIARHALKLLKDPASFANMKARLIEVRKQLGERGASERAAGIILQ